MTAIQGCHYYLTLTSHFQRWFFCLNEAVRFLHVVEYSFYLDSARWSNIFDLTRNFTSYHFISGGKSYLSDASAKFVL